MKSRTFYQKLVEVAKFGHKYSVFSDQVHVILLEKFRRKSKKVLPCLMNQVFWFNIFQKYIY